MRILVTGAAGFIGFHLAKRYLDRGEEVVGIDNLNDYYDVRLKEARLAELKPREGFRFERMDICDRPALERLFDENSFDLVLHMAAQAGVRYSLENPHAYVQSNLVGFANVLECCRHQWASSLPFVRGGSGRSRSRHLVYASSSSVYGLNTKLPFSVADRTEHPASLYGATKKANELMAHAYSHLYGMPTTGLRLFTAYGPWGRPDMALFKFTRAILAGEPIDLYNDGKMSRDFTYIADAVECVVRIGLQASGVRLQEKHNLKPEACSPKPVACIYNIGNSSSVALMDFIAAIEAALGKKAKIDLRPMQPGDIPATYADVSDLERDIAFTPSTPIGVGVAKFVEWYKSYYVH